MVRVRKDFDKEGLLAHNTVSIAGRDSSEVWSGFRVGARSRITERLTRLEKSTMFALGAHAGYSRKNVELLHQREFALNSNSFKVIDKISYPESSEVRYYLHPDLVAKKIGNASGKIEGKNNLVLTWKFLGSVLG